MWTMTQLRQIGLAVSNLEQSIEWFQKVFGAKLVSGPNDMPAEKTRAAYVKAGTITYELMADMDGTGAIGRFIQKRGEGIQALHTRVDSVQEAAKDLTAKGVSIIGQGSPFTFIHPRSAKGVMWELIQDRGEPWPTGDDEGWPGKDLKLSYIGIAVQDMESGIQFYRDVLGGKLEGVGEIPGENTKSANFRLGGVTVELMSSTQEGDAISTFIAKKGEGIYNIRYNVPDLAKTLAHVEAAGVRIGARRGDQYAYLSPKDCHGILFIIGQARS